MALGADEELRAALSGRGPAWVERVAVALREAKEALGEAADGEIEHDGLPLAAERLVRETEGLACAERLRVAAFAIAAAKVLYPPHAHSAGAARLARVVAHRAGYGPDVVEPAVALARWSILLGMLCQVHWRLIAASLEANTSELATLARLVGIADADKVARFEALCRSSSCWGKPAEPYPLPEDIPARVRRYVLEAMADGMCESPEQAHELARSLGREGTGHLIITVGIPGSGKTTWVERHLGHELIISMDRMRAVILGDASDQSQNELIYRRSLTALEHALARGKRVVFDATNYDRPRRESLRRLVRKTGAKMTMIYFDIPLDEALRRNEMRPRKVPSEPMRRAYRHIEAPRVDEADEVLIVSPAWPTPRRWVFESGRWVWEATPVDDPTCILR